MFKYLCCVRYAKISELSERFGVSKKTIARDVFEIEILYHVTLDLKRGRYGGGVYVKDNSSFVRMYLYVEEIELLIKLQELTENIITHEESQMLSQMIRNYQKKTK